MILKILRGQQEALVKWHNRDLVEATWESYEDLHHQFPNFPISAHSEFEEELDSQQGSIDTSPVVTGPPPTKTPTTARPKRTTRPPARFID
ncbi:hypothetical protein L2E82_10701 [Cichorium intybus]|uniref:Uncharacterized protein n=1 Tax=Cichorium intybus TaxID=13427 RepID=A0ACB9GB53_CICIN|nr:hypothetical protein L2E82_10701 [Cichorium intybus]